MCSTRSSFEYMKYAYFEPGPRCRVRPVSNRAREVIQLLYIRITNLSYLPNRDSASHNSPCVVPEGNCETKMTPPPSTCSAPAREGSVFHAVFTIARSLLTALVSLEHFRNTMASRSRTNNGCSAYACKVRFTPSASANMTSARVPPGLMMMRWTSPNRWKMGRMSVLRVFGGRFASVMVTEESISPIPS